MGTSFYRLHSNYLVLKTTNVMITLKQLAGCLVFSSILIAQTSPFPSALDTDATLKVAINGVSTRLLSTINSVSTTFTVVSCNGILPNTLLTIELEIVPVTACSGTTLVVDSRGFDNTIAVAHQGNAAVKSNVEAWNINAPNSAVKAIETTLGSNLVNIPTFPVLAMATGTTLVGNKALGTGAVSRTQSAKNSDFVSVFDYGAVCDNGVTDDRVAIQKAIDAVGSGTLWFSSSLACGVSSPGLYLYPANAGMTVQGLHNGTFGSAGGGLISYLASPPSTIFTIFEIGRAHV